jgi:hypothetical protein
MSAVNNSSSKSTLKPACIIVAGLALFAIILVVLFFLFLPAELNPISAMFASATSTTTRTPTGTATFTPTNTATITLTPTITFTPTITGTLAPSGTPTLEPLTGTANGSAFCRWGPGKAYLSSYTLNDGDSVSVEGRNWLTTWLYVQPEGLAWKCWMATSTLTVNGDPKGAKVAITTVPTNAEVQAPTAVKAERKKDTVTITWHHIPSALERGYLLEVRVCVGGYLTDAAYTTTEDKIIITDERSCGGGSFGEIRGQNKLGYSSAVTIPWPAP